MEEDNTFINQIKPMTITSSEKIEQLGEEYLTKLSDFKKLKNKMETIEATVKNYLIENNLDILKCKSGKFNIINQDKMVLDRSLIEDIDKYKVNTKYKMMYKSLN